MSLLPKAGPKRGLADALIPAFEADDELLIRWLLEVDNDVFEQLFSRDALWRIEQLAVELRDAFPERFGID